MTKAERTRQYIIEKTAPLFNTKGFEGTSLNDLTQATGFTKGALYGNFHDKEEIASEAFRYAVKKVREVARKRVEVFSSPKKQLMALFEFYGSYVFHSPVPGGCPLLNTAIEADDHRTTMRRAVASEIDRTVNFIATLIRKGMKAGEFRRNIRPKEIAYVFFCAIEGAIMFSRVERSRVPMNIIIRHCKQKLEQISQ